MKALLIISHGSRREASNQEVRDLTEKVRPSIADSYDIVETAFLELAAPLIPDGLRCCVRQGATEIVVLPYFLAAGRHVATDIPEIVDGVRDEFPDVQITVASHLGGSDSMVSFVAGEALSHG